MTKLTSDYIRNNVLPAQQGIQALTDDYEKELLEQFLQDNKDLFTQPTNGTLYRYSDNGAGTLRVITSVGCGKYEDIWDHSNCRWSEATPEQEVKWDELDLRNQVAQYRQSLVARNDVLQSADKAERALLKKVSSLTDKLERVAERHDQWVQPDGFYDYCAEGPGSDLYEVYEQTKVWSIELVAEYRDYVEGMIDFYNDGGSL